MKQIETLASRLKSLRKEKGLSLEKLAKDLKTTKVTISRYENGIREPKGQTLNLLADYFNVSTDYLFVRTNKRNNLHYEENKVDVKKVIDEIMDDFKFNNSCLMFDGEPMDKEELNSLLQSIEVVLTIAKKKQEEKLKAY